MNRTKRGRAINGDIFTLAHPTAALDAPFTSFVDVSFRGTTHQAFVAADRGAFSYATTTGEFTVRGLRGHIVETLDTVNVQATHRYQAIIESDAGVLSIHSYENADHLLSLVGALRPTETTLGLALDPDDEVEYTSTARVALQLSLGVVELTPLTNEIIDQLPTWAGSAVNGGELYGGRFTDDAAYLTLVTPTSRVLVLPAAGVDEDALAADVAALEAVWES